MPIIRFDELVDPISNNEFFGSYWQQEPLYLSRDERNYYGDLFSVDELDTLIEHNSHNEKFLINILDLDDIEDPYSSDGSVNYQTVVEAFSKGGSVRVVGLEDFSEPVHGLALAIERAVSAPVRMNVYLTPPEEQTLGQHQDDHDVFVIQTDGKKHWKVYDKPGDRPLARIALPAVKRKNLASQHILDRYLPQNGVASESRDPIIDTTLERGDLLYIPRGYYHEAQTTDELSMHITAGIFGYTWYDAAVYALSQIMKEHGDLRDYLPPGFARDNGNNEEIGEKPMKVEELVRKHFSAEDVTEALEVIKNRFIRSRKRSFRGHVADVDRSRSLDLDEEMEIRSDITWYVDRGEESIDIVFDGTVVGLPKRVEPLIEFITNKGRFHIGDLPSEFSDNSKKVLVRYLVKEGFLTFASKPVSARDAMSERTPESKTLEKEH